MRVRIDYARRLARLPPGDKEARTALRSERAAHLAASYSQLVAWQQDMAALGCTHSDASLHHLLQALDRLNCSSDAMQLAGLFERLRPSTNTAHTAALKASLRKWGPQSAGQADALAGALHERGALTKADYVALLFKQFWMDGDHKQLLETVARLRQEGWVRDQGLGQMLLQQLAAAGLWRQVVEVMDDLAEHKWGQQQQQQQGRGGLQLQAGAEGRVLPDKGQQQQQQRAGMGGTNGAVDQEVWESKDADPATSSSSSRVKKRGRKRVFDTVELSAHERAQLGEVAPHDGIWRSRVHAEARPVRQEASGSGFGVATDGLWHIILRSLISQGQAANEVVGALVERMSKRQLLRFRQMYPSLRQKEDGSWTVQPAGSWEIRGDEKGEEVVEGLGEERGDVKGLGGGESAAAGGGGAGVAAAPLSPAAEAVMLAADRG